jgi:hypothetical protein
MVSYNDNYKISSQLAKTLNEFDLPYGGINMIFSGDFAQLPPVFGSPLYSGTVGTQLLSRMTVQGQEAAIGMASSDYSCNTKKEYETKNTNSRRY